MSLSDQNYRNYSNPLLNMYRSSMEMREQISMTQDKMVGHWIIYQFELQHAVIVFSQLVTHINCTGS